MGEPGGLPSMGSHRVGHDWSALAAAALFCLLIYFNDLIFSFGCTGSLLLFNSCSLVVVHRLLSLQRMGSKMCGLQQLWPMGLVALRQLGPSQTREWTSVPWIGRLFPNHWTTCPSSWVWSDISLCFGGVFLRFFFNMDHFLNLYWIFYNTASIFCFGFWPRGMWDLSSQTSTLCFGRGSPNPWTARDVISGFWSAFP